MTHRPTLESFAVHIPPRPEGRFNEWGERKWPSAESQWVNFVQSESAKLRLSPRASSLCQAAMLTYSRGVEFVFFSNAQLPDTVHFESGIVIVPCFMPFDYLRGMNGDDRAAAMMKQGLFIYDGWVPNEEWTQTRLEEIVTTLDDITNLFSLSGRYYASWEPKYWYSRPPVQFLQVTLLELESLAKTINVAEQLASRDRAAIHRSAAWIANAAKDESSVQRFLLLFVSIEALATYIEQESGSDSPLRVFAADRLSRTERSEQREICIHQVLDRDLSTDAAHAIRTAYFECVVGTRKMLEEHLNRVFGDDHASKLMFKEEIAGKTLWQLRNDIAHGSLNILSEEAIQYLTMRVADLEKIARDYVRKMLTHLAGVEYFTPVRRPGFVLPASNAIGVTGTEYMGPTDMAEYYANVEGLASSYVKVRFD